MEEAIVSVVRQTAESMNFEQISLLKLILKVLCLSHRENEFCKRNLLNVLYAVCSIVKLHFTNILRR